MKHVRIIWESSSHMDVHGLDGSDEFHGCMGTYPQIIEVEKKF